MQNNKINLEKVKKLINNIRYNYLNKSSKSFVVKILTLDCLLNAFSSDQIAQSNFKANAKYGMSLECGEVLCASKINLSYSNFEIDSIFFSSKENKNINSFSSIEEYSFIFSLSFSNSSNMKSGEINLKSLEGKSCIKLLLEESLLKKENNMLASTTRNICITNNYDACLSAILFFNSSPNFMANSSVILLFFNNSSAILKRNFSLNFSFNADLISSFNSSLLNLLAAYSKSLGNVTNTFAILYNISFEVYKSFDLKDEKINKENNIRIPEFLNYIELKKRWFQ